MGKIVRTPTRAEGGITIDEKAAMDIHTKKWIDIAMKTGQGDRTAIYESIKGIYLAANLKAPRIVIVPSPLVMAFAYGASAAIWYERKNKKITHAATRAATHAATYDATRDATNAATYDAESQAASACFLLAGKLGLECAKRWGNVYQGGNMWAGWISYLSAARDILGLSLPTHKEFSHYENAAINSGFRVMHEEFCIVSDFPTVLKVDAENRPHCENGPSHQWADGWSLHHWHGVKVPAEWIENKASLTAQMALTWPNIEQRRAACEIIGWAKILKELDAKVIDKDGDPEIGTLLEVDLPDSGKERFIYVRCGTLREFALPVPRDCGDTALSANAWTYGLDGDTYRPEVRT